MRLSLASLGILAMTTVAIPADLPAPDKLPSVAEFPDVLATRDGTKITTKKDWEERRRPELKELFQHYMYGRFPAKPTKVTAKVLFEDTKAFDGKGTLREVEITFGPPEWPKIYLLIAVPNGKAPGRVLRRAELPRQPRADRARQGPHPDGVGSGERPQRGEEQGDRGGPRQAGRHVAAATGRGERLRGRDVLLRRHPTRPRRRAGGHAKDDAGLQERSARRDRDRHVVGVGLSPRPSISWSRTRASTRSASRWSATRGWARRRCSRARSTSGSRW